MNGRNKRLIFIVVFIIILTGCKDIAIATSTQTSDVVDTEFVGESELQQDVDIPDQDIQELSDNVELNSNDTLSPAVDEHETEVNLVVDDVFESISNVQNSELIISPKDEDKSNDQIENDVVPATPVNNAPNVMGENILTLEDQSILLSDLLANDLDEDGDELYIKSFSQSIYGGKVEMVEANVLKYTPAFNFHGMDSFMYVVGDDAGGSAVATVDINVENINDVPQATGEKIVLFEDETVLLTDLIENDIDLDGDVLSIQSFSQGTEGGVVQLLSSNILKYTPVLNYYGTDSFTYFVTDGKGEPVAATVNIQIQEVNDLPKVLDEVVTILEDQSVVLSNLLENDSDIDNDKLIIISVEQSVNGGMVELLNEKELSYLPAADFYGTDSFNYTVADGKGGIAIGSVTVFVEEVNDVPVAKTDYFIVIQNKAKELDVLLNDIGVSENVSIALMSLPKNGKLELGLNGKVIYTPNSDYFGQDSFIYQVVDKDGEVSVATASLGIECVNNCNRVFTIAWEPSVSSNIVAYKVYYGNEASNLNQLVQLSNVTSYDHLVDVKGEYFFAVSAVNDKNVESELTGIVSGVF